MRRCAVCGLRYYGRGSSRGSAEASCVLWPICPRGEGRQRDGVWLRGRLEWRLAGLQVFLQMVEVLAWRMVWLQERLVTDGIDDEGPERRERRGE